MWVAARRTRSERCVRGWYCGPGAGPGGASPRCRILTPRSLASFAQASAPPPPGAISFGRFEDVDMGADEDLPPPRFDEPRPAKRRRRRDADAAGPSSPPRPPDAGGSDDDSLGAWLKERDLRPLPVDGPFPLAAGVAPPPLAAGVAPPPLAAGVAPPPWAMDEPPPRRAGGKKQRKQAKAETLAKAREAKRVKQAARRAAAALAPAAPAAGLRAPGMGGGADDAPSPAALSRGRSDAGGSEEASDGEVSGAGRVRRARVWAAGGPCSRARGPLLTCLPPPPFPSCWCRPPPPPHLPCAPTTRPLMFPA
jgi:hypothetical protein